MEASEIHLDEYCIQIKNIELKAYRPTSQVNYTLMVGYICLTSTLHVNSTKPVFTNELYTVVLLS